MVGGLGNYLPLVVLALSFHFLSEKKEVRSLAALGVIYVVKTAWLEDCDREKKEIPVLQRHIAYDLLLPKGLLVTT
jgi:hypothetical protein